MNNPASLAIQGEREILISQVRPVLASELAEWNIDPDAVYFNAVDNLENRTVIDSATLCETAVTAIQNKENPTYPNWGGSGFFSEAYSFADVDRIPNPPPHEKFAEVVNVLVGQLG
jgi:hypothetical protein